MKIAVLSDIHGNLPALQTVAAHIERWRPDRVVVNGDVVNRGPQPAACWALVQELRLSQGWEVVGGNHEAYVAAWATGEQTPDHPEFEFFRSSYWTCHQMGAEAVQLEALPARVEISGPDGRTVRFTHASMHGYDDGIYPEAADATVREQIAPAPAVFLTAHTHRPFVRRVDGTLVVNSGAAGWTFDGDPRASYVQLSWQGRGWEAALVRLDYDREAMARAFATGGFLEESGPLTAIFYEEWAQARPLINRWFPRYRDPVLAGQIGMEEAVAAFLEQEREEKTMDRGRLARTTRRT